LVVVDSNCSLKFSATNSTTANALPAQTCTLTDATGTEVDTFTSVVFTTPDGVTGRLSMTYNGAVTSGGSAVTCTANETADLIKL